MGEFKIDRSLMRPEELGQVSSTLTSLSTALGDARMGQAADRIRAIAPKGLVAGKSVPENYVFVELAPARRERDKIREIRGAIEERRVAAFAYVDSEGRTSRREVEPAALVFTWQSWYLYAYCRIRAAFRLFKIARVGKLEILSERFSPRPVDLDSRPWNQAWAEASPFLPTRLRFFESRLVDEHFEPGDIQREGEDNSLVSTRLPADDWAVGFLLGLGIPFEVIEPESLRRLVAERAARIQRENS